MRKNIKYFLEEIYGTVFFLLFRLFPIKNNKIVFSSFGGRNYDGNPRYISEYLKKNRKDIEQVWIIRNNTNIEFENNIKKANFGSIKMIYEMATAAIWIDSHNMPAWIKKRKKQKYIQVWHGGLGMKKIVNDFAGVDAHYKRIIRHNAQNANVFISNSIHITNIYRKAFNYKGEICEVGFPKNDIFYAPNKIHNTIRKDVLEKLNIDEDKRIVLYAPTFRENKRLDVYNIDFKRLKQALENKYNKNFVIVFRLHPDIRNLSDEFKEKNIDIVDATSYDNMQDLIIATDIFITDYSSGIFDFASLRRPGFLFATDIDEYKKERGLYYDLHTMPFPLAENNEQLYYNIINFNEEEYLVKLEQFFIDMGLKDNANSTEKVAKIIEDYIDNRRK